MHRTTIAILIACIGVLAPAAAWANAVLIEGDSGEVLPTVRQEIVVTIESQVATTTVTTHFGPVFGGTGVFGFGVPENAAAYELVLIIDGVEQTAEVTPGDQAEYPDDLDEQESTALATYLGDNPLRTWLSGLPHDQPFQVRLTYVELLPFYFGDIEYTLPLVPFTGDQAPIEELTIDLQLSTDRTIEQFEINLDHPFVDVPDDQHVHIMQAIPSAPRSEDLQLRYHVTQTVFGIRLYAYRPLDNPWVDELDGYFLLLLEPPTESDEVSDKYFTYVIDRSGSMGGDKIVYARNAATTAVQGLHSGDWFDVVAFDDSLSVYSGNHVPATPANQEDAMGWIGDLQAGGSTDIHAALMEALDENPGDLPYVILFMTDGQATAGIVSPQQILASVGPANVHDASIYSVAIGGDANLGFLLALAEEHRGMMIHIADYDDMEAQLELLFARINNPLLIQPQLTLGGAATHDVLPDELPDLYLGNQLVVVGRYATPGPLICELQGELGQSVETYEFEGNLPVVDEDNSFVGRIWAVTMVQHLLAEIAVHGETQELIDQIVEIGTAYGINTPYTPFQFDPEGDDDDDDTGDDDVGDDDGGDDDVADDDTAGDDDTGAVEDDDMGGGMDSAGCSCTVGGRTIDAGGLVPLALLGIAALLRRRR